MIDIIAHEGVTQWRFSTVAGRLSNYSSSAFLTADGILIDTGIPAASRALVRLLDRTTIRGAMLTHHHEDHAGNAELLASRGVPLWIAPSTLPLVTTVAPIATYRRTIWASMRPLQSAVTPFEPAGLEPIATPGHSADHHVIWDATTRTLFSGDLFLGVAVRIAHHDEDPWQSIASLERAAGLGAVRMFDAHRGLVIHPSSALRAKAVWTRKLIDTVSARVEHGESDRQILAAVMGGESLAGYLSVGEYSRRNFVKAVRRRIEQAAR